MISLLIFGLIASAYAAPHSDFGDHHHHHHHHGPPRFLSHYRSPLNNNNYFDTDKFWSDFQKEMKDFDDMLAEFSHHFPTRVSQEGVEGNEYKITIALSGFEEKDIKVKARECWLMIQAHHRYSDGNERDYLDVRTLPNTVKVNGTWNYDKGVLKIVFPLKEGVETPTVESVSVISTDPTTKTPAFDRGVVDRNHVEETESYQDADVGLNRGDIDAEVTKNEIEDRNAVEATTYAVDLKDEVEFVPVKY